MKHAIGLPKIFSKTMIFALLGCIFLLPDPAMAKIYKYKDDQGRTHFTDDASKIPLKYREQGAVKKFRGVNEPTPASSTPPGFPGQASAGGGGGEGVEVGAGVEEDEGLNEKDEALVNKTIQIFRVGIALGNKYKNTMPNFTNGRGAVDDIQRGLPLKESLASELAGTKVPELKEALGFLNQSIAVDKQTTSVGAGLPTRIAGIFRRLADEGEQQSALIQKLEKVLEDSEKKKAEAAKKKEEVSKKEKKK